MFNAVPTDIVSVTSNDVEVKKYHFVKGMNSAVNTFAFGIGTWRVKGQDFLRHHSRVWNGQGWFVPSKGLDGKKKYSTSLQMFAENETNGEWFLK